MSAGPDPRTVNPPHPDPRQQQQQLIEQERRRLSQRLDEVARLCESGMPPMAFYQEMLTRLLESLAAVAGSVYTRTPQGNLQQQYAINTQQVGVDATDEARAAHHGLLHYAFTTGETMSLPPGAMGKAEPGKPAPGNPTQTLLLVVPIRQNEQVVGLLEVFQGANRPPSATQGFLQYMTLMADLVGRYLRNALVGQLVGQQQLWTQLESFARTLHASLNITEVAFNVANEGRRLIECDRVSVSIRRGGEKSKVEAVSGTDVVEHRSNLVQRMNKLADAVFDWGERLVYNGDKDDTLPPKVLAAMDAYLEESPSKFLVVMPLRDEREKGDKDKDKPGRPPRSMLFVECFETPLDTDQLVARLDVVSKHATTALYNAVEYRRIPMRWLWGSLASAQENLGGRMKSYILLGVAAVSVIGGLLAAFPYPLKMEAAGSLLPVVRRTVYTPINGTIERFAVEPNAVVAEGQLLAVMYDLELGRKLNMLHSEIKSAGEAVEAAVARSRIATTEQDKMDANIRAATKRGEQDQKNIERADLIRRTHAVGDERGGFRLLAPMMTPDEKRKIGRPDEFRWTVLSSNFKSDFERREVKPNEPIMRLGAKGGPWEVELKIPQKHVGQVLRGFERLKEGEPLLVDFLLTTDSTVVFQGMLYRDRVSNEANPNREDGNDPEPFVLAYVDIEDPRIPGEYRAKREQLLSGVEVRSKIRCGDVAAGYALFYGVYEFVYEKVIFWLF